jgi:hypothetical protein
MLKNYGKQTDSSTYFENLFLNLDNYSKSNAKIFSQLKHLSYELSGMLSKTGETIKKIATLYEEFMQNTDSHYKRIQFQGDENVKGMSKKLHIGLFQWGVQLNSQRKFVVDNMASFFHFKKHEYLEISNMISNKMDLNTQYKKRLQTLDDKKLKLFESKNIEKWKIDYKAITEDFNEIFKSYPKVKPYMLPEVSLAGIPAARTTSISR